MINFSAIAGEPFLQAYLLTLLATLSTYVVLRAGVYSIATVGFMGISAYTSAILTTKYEAPTIVSVIAGVALATLAGAVLGKLIEKLRGAYQAIATLAFVMIVQLVAFSWTPVTGGYLGITGVPFWATTAWLLVIAVLATIGCIALELSNPGRRQRAAFHDEIAAASIGVNVARQKLVAVILSAALGGLAGVTQAGNQYVVDSTIYGFALVISVLSCVVIGGSRSVVGPIVGTFVVVSLPLLFSSYATLAAIIVALVTILIMILLPRGIVQVLPFDAASIYRALRPGAKRSTHETDEQFLEKTRASVDSLVGDAMARSFGAVRAVAGVSLQVQPGQIVGLIGPNGAGKTSVLNLIAGVTRLDEGNISIGTSRLETLPAHLVEKQGIARTFQTCRLFGEATVWENVMLAAASGRSVHRRRELSDVDCARAALELAGCLDLADRSATELPYSHQRAVEIARGLATEPLFLLLDEPAAGMSNSEADQLTEVVTRIAARGVGVLVIDHNVTWICSISSRVIVQNFGTVIADGAPDETLSNPVVLEAYIGVETSEEDAASFSVGTAATESGGFDA